jgi:hypothetical protein
MPFGILRDVRDTAKTVGGAIGAALKRAKAKRQRKKAAKAEAAAQAALQRSEQLAARAGIGGSMVEAKISPAPSDTGAVESKFISDVKDAFNFMQWVRKNIVAVGIGSAAFIGFVLWLIFRKKRKRR